MTERNLISAKTLSAFLLLPALCYVPPDNIAYADFEYRGNLALELTAFTATSDHEASQASNLSVSGEVELYKGFSDGTRSLVATPFFRLDQHDDDRSHFDFRELYYQQVGDSWELKAGIGKIFWGVAESRNVVDVINQSDSVEGISSNDKLGQPMVQFSWIADYGNFDFFLLPGFREQTFPSEDGRPRPTIAFNTDNARYESDDEENHIDYAMRYSHIVDEWDIGLSWFEGTSRDPLIQPNATPESFTLVPYYYQVQQVGVDLQATLESWLLKFEAIHRSGDAIENHSEAVAGFEYSFYGVADSDTDIGIVFEYLYDEMGSDAYHPMQNDLLIAARVALNDEQSSEALIGVITDVDGGGQILTLEANRRIGSSFKVSLETTVWLNTEDDAQLDSLKNDDYLQAEIAWYF